MKSKRVDTDQSSEILNIMNHGVDETAMTDTRRKVNFQSMYMHNNEMLVQEDSPAQEYFDQGDYFGKEEYKEVIGGRSASTLP